MVHRRDDAADAAQDDGIEQDLSFRARRDEIINQKHELVLLAGKIDRDWIDGEIAPLYSENGRPGIDTRFMIGLLLLKHVYRECRMRGFARRSVHQPLFPVLHRRRVLPARLPTRALDLSHWRKRLGDKLLLLAESLRGARGRRVT